MLILALVVWSQRLRAAAPAAAPSPAAPRGVAAEKVDAALEKAKAFLYSQQKNGNWEDVQAPEAKVIPPDVKSGQWGGLTAIATYALLAAGENPQDDRLRSAIEFLQKAEIQGIYALGLRAQVWNLVPDSPAVKKAAN